jgi:hypothetical protein
MLRSPIQRARSANTTGVPVIAQSNARRQAIRTGRCPTLVETKPKDENQNPVITKPSRTSART